MLPRILLRRQPHLYVVFLWADDLAAGRPGEPALAVRALLPRLGLASADK